jgi:uncharacterized protein (UPF0264 family)
METFEPLGEQPGLLVSVRDAEEAEAALAGGADIIDVKEPTRGPLGAADASAVVSVVSAVAGRAPVSIAVGELLDWSEVDWQRHVETIGGGIAYCKFGLAGCSNVDDWHSRWRQAAAMLGEATQPVAVVYADWQKAAAPRPDQVLAIAQSANCRVLLVDTWDKRGGTLLDHWSFGDLNDFGHRVHRAGLGLVLAGSLAGTQLQLAARCRPALLAVRGAACQGGRGGRVTAARVAAIRAAIGGMGRDSSPLTASEFR